MQHKQDQRFSSDDIDEVWNAIAARVGVAIRSAMLSTCLPERSPINVELYLDQREILQARTSPCLIQTSNSFESLCNMPILQLLEQEETELQRNPDTARALLLELEASPDWLHVISLHNQSPATEKDRFFHARLLADEGFLEASGKSSDVFRITNKGHDFLGLTRDEGIWNGAKKMVGKLAGHSLTMILSAAEGIVADQLQEMIKLKS